MKKREIYAITIKFVDDKIRIFKWKTNCKLCRKRIGSSRIWLIKNILVLL